MHAQTYRQHARTHTYTYTHTLLFTTNHIILIYLISSMYLTGVCNYFMKYLVYNNCNKIPMGHIAHLRKILKYFQYNFPYYCIILWKKAWTFIWINLNSLYLGYFLPCLVKIGLVVLKTLKMWKVYWWTNRQQAIRKAYLSSGELKTARLS